MLLLFILVDMLLPLLLVLNPLAKFKLIDERKMMQVDVTLKLR
jgi:hypothetical protein